MNATRTPALTWTMLAELRSIARTGEPSSPFDWWGSGSLWFRNRDRVLGALIRRGLITDANTITPAGHAALDALDDAEQQGAARRAGIRREIIWGRRSDLGVSTGIRTGGVEQVVAAFLATRHDRRDTDLLLACCDCLDAPETLPAGSHTRVTFERDGKPQTVETSSWSRRD